MTRLQQRVLLRGIGTNKPRQWLDRRYEQHSLSLERSPDAAIVPPLTVTLPVASDPIATAAASLPISTLPSASIFTDAPCTATAESGNTNRTLSVCARSDSRRFTRTFRANVNLRAGDLDGASD